MSNLQGSPAGQGPLQTQYAYLPVSPADPGDGPAKSPAGYSITSKINTNDDGKQPRWKPFTLNTPFLSFFFLATITMIILIEVINQKSLRHQGLFFAETVNDFNTWENFSYNYLMTIISVLYGMAWASVDLDVKRLEPFFQLASAKGATAANSLLLCYPFDFLAFVPITAFGRRHWSVFCSGFALVLIFWVITPMQSALLTTDTVTLHIPTEFVSYKNLMSLEEQGGPDVTAQYLFTAYGVSFLDEQLRPFTTQEYAAMPFRPLDTASEGLVGGGNETWTAVTRTYTTDLDCTLATKVSSDNPYNLTNNAGCSKNVTGLTIKDGAEMRALLYMGFGFYGYGGGNYVLNSGEPDWCKGGPHLFLAVWQHLAAGATDPDVTGVYCTPIYYYTDMKVTVDSNTLVVKDAVPVGDPVSFTEEDGLVNITRFENDMSAGEVETIESLPPKWVITNPPSSAARFEDWGITDSTNQIIFTVGTSQNLTFEDFKDPKVLSDAFRRTHKLLFANFIYSSLEDMAEGDINKHQVQGDRIVVKSAVIVVGVFAHLLEAFLAIVAICFAVLGVISYRRNANLFGDPDSLAAKMAIVADSKALLQDFDGLDECPDLQKELPKRTYRLDNWDSNGYYRIDYEGSSTTKSSISSNAKKQFSGLAIRPLVLSTLVGVSMALFFAGIVGLLIFLFKSAQKNNGLPTLSDNQVVVQLIFSAIPTVLATGMEPLWVLLTRYFCVYQPYIELLKGGASSSRSLAIKYTNVPPALVVIRALRSKHFMLFALSATALLANLLAVSLGGLFQNEVQPMETPTTFTQPLSPMIDPQVRPVAPTSYGYLVDGNFVKDSQDPWIIVMTNLTQGAPLPPWVANDYYFLPFEWMDSANASKAHRAITQGFGIDLDCKDFTSSDLKSQVFLTLMPEFRFTIPVPGSKDINCTTRATYSYDMLEGPGIPGQRVAIEITQRPYATGYYATQTQLESCASRLIISWGRGTVTKGKSSVYDFCRPYGSDACYRPQLDFNTYTNVTLICQPKLKTAMFDVTVDADSRVQSYEKIPGSDKDPAALFKDPQKTMLNFTTQIAQVIQVSGGTSTGNAQIWSNDTYPGLIPHYLAEKITNTSFCNPNKPLANFSALADAYNKTAQRIFPIILALNSDAVFTKQTASSNTLINGFEINMVERVAVNTIMFYISVVIMGINIIVGIFTFIFRPKTFLPRFPDTLASEIAYYYSSQALSDVSGTVAMSSASRDKHLNRLGYTYGFGWFRGRDGRKHRGIERSSILEDS